VAEHPDVRNVLAFGEGQFSLGLLVEVNGEKTSIHHDAFRLCLKSYLERGNSLTDKHGQVSLEMIIFTHSSTKPLLLTDKGSLARKANYAAFAEEIQACYDRAEASEAPVLPHYTIEGGNSLRQAIRSLVREVCPDERLEDDTDFFEFGMDSLKATRLRRRLVTALGPQDGSSPSTTIGPDFCYQHPSISKLYQALKALMDGNVLPPSTHTDNAEDRIGAMLSMLNKYLDKLQNMPASRSTTPTPEAKSKMVSKTVILTGSTGSLGCHLLARLADDPSVVKVFCLNRPRKGEDRLERQQGLMRKRGASMSPEHWKKVVLYEVNFGEPRLGLGGEEYEEVCLVVFFLRASV
jgi:hypothetical protein